MNNRDGLLKNVQQCGIKSFGPLNPDKIYLVIRQEGKGRGLFSLLSSIVCYLDVAEKNGLVPVVDFENFETTYNESYPVHGTRNSFEYYFEPVGQTSLQEVYQSKFVLLTGNGYPAGYSYAIDSEKGLFSVFQKYIQYRPEVVARVEHYSDLVNGRVLGVHFRGQEMRTAPGHWFPPSERQMVAAIDRMLADGGFTRIFVVTEDAGLLRSLVRHYRDLVVSCDHFRTERENAYNIYPRANHKYLLGLEVLVDMILLSRCSGLVACTSNVAAFARFVNNGNYTSQIKINNGPNSSRRRLARVLWAVKNALPPVLGGFSIGPTTLIQTKREEIA